jgi:hypothetical protein
MRFLRWSFVAVAVVVLGGSCGGSSPQPAALQSRWSAPSILSRIPAESPYVVALLDPVSDALRRQLMQMFDERLAQMAATFDKLAAADRAAMQPWQRMVFAFLDDLRGKPTSTWMEQYGFDPRGRFAIYGLSLWPALRVEIADPAKLRAAILRIFAAGGIKPEDRTLDGHPYWVLSNRDFTAVFATIDREFVSAVVPTAVLDSALPLVLGTKVPEHSLAATTVVPELLARHRFLGTMVAYFDSHRIVDIIAGDKPQALDIPIRMATGTVTPECRGDLDRLAAAFPRLVFGYRRFDDAGFDASAIFELASDTVAGLRKLRGAAPEVTARSDGNAMFSLGAAGDLEAGVAWVQTTARGLHDHPFRCAWFTKLNKAVDEIADAVAKPLPPQWRGLRGYAMTIDNASISPPEVSGHIVVTGDRVADLVTSLAGSVPAFAGTPMARDGKPIALPVQQLGLPVTSAHVALTTDRLVIAAGSGSDRRATQHLASPVPKSSPLASMAFDVPRLQALLASFGQPTVMGLSTARTVGFSFDVTEFGFDVDLWGTWQPAAPAPAPAQIAAPPKP